MRSDNFTRECKNDSASSIARWAGIGTPCSFAAIERDSAIPPGYVLDADIDVAAELVRETGFVHLRSVLITVGQGVTRAVTLAADAR